MSYTLYSALYRLTRESIHEKEGGREGARGGSRARSLYATPPSPPPPPPRVLKDSGAGSATNKCL